ncbi:MAG: nucleotidyltransferase domain-containing protein [Sphingobacteriaceae bacterium]|nr:nucleotidyltransferase domain-containing protein [Sphingobacteriaceae bacterium]
MLSDAQQEVIKSVTKKLRPTLLGVFGSYARNEASVDSDLDLLIDFEQRVNLIDLIGIEQELSKSLGIKVDLVTKRSVHTALAPYIEADLIRLI